MRRLQVLVKTCKNVSRLGSSRNAGGSYETKLKRITNKVTVDLDLLSAFVENRICSNLNGRLTVTIKGNRRMHKNVKIKKQAAKPFESHRVIAIE